MSVSVHAVCCVRAVCRVCAVEVTWRVWDVCACEHVCVCMNVCICFKEVAQVIQGSHLLSLKGCKQTGAPGRRERADPVAFCALPRAGTDESRGGHRSSWGRLFPRVSLSVVGRCGEHAAHMSRAVLPEHQLGLPMGGEVSMTASSPGLVLDPTVLT